MRADTYGSARRQYTNFRYAAVRTWSRREACCAAQKADRPGSSLQPRRHQAAAVVVAEVGAVVLERPVPRRHIDRGRRLDVVLLLREVFLDAEDDLSSLCHVERSTLPDEHVGEHGI